MPPNLPTFPPALLGLAKTYRLLLCAQKGICRPSRASLKGNSRGLSMKMLLCCSPRCASHGDRQILLGGSWKYPAGAVARVSAQAGPQPV